MADGTVRAPNGMVATSHPLAVQAALELLDAGGSAADAAVAAAAVLCVVDPRSTGIGGDAFALCWSGGDRAPTALAGAGPASSRLSVDALRDAGFSAMPEAGPWAITVPGAVSAWYALLDRYGRAGISRALEPAIAVAEAGFAVTPIVAADWVRDADRLRGDEAARRTFLPAPAYGTRFRNPELAATLRELIASGAEGFYRGALGRAIGAAVQAAGGPLGADDLAAWGGAEWVEPLRRRYRGVDVYEHPPPGQGIVTLDALGIYEGLDPVDRVDCEHAAIEALERAFADARAQVADPRFAGAPNTVYVAVADREGGACSFIQSLYMGFGSGICVPGTGMLLQNRGSGFVLEDGHPNRPEPGKRPYHTIMPAMLGRDGAFLGCLGVVGALMQPQGQFQIIRGLLDRGLGPQAALDAPRFRVQEERRVAFEPGFDPAVVDALAARGHEVCELDTFDAGGAQLVLREADGYAGASDTRKDGCARGR